MKDGEGQEIVAGDWIHFSYGIPPVRVEAEIIDRDGKLIALTPDHNPTECPLNVVRACSEFYKLER